MRVDNEIDRLGQYLMEKYPIEIGKEALGHGRGIVDVAIRLLDKFKIIDTNIRRYKIVERKSQ
jgi:hypothetical protein